MLEPVFLALVNRSLTALWLVAAVLVLRLVFRGAPKWTRGILWALLAVRLVLPFGVPSRYSVYNIAEHETDWNGNLEYVSYVEEEAGKTSAPEGEELPAEIVCPSWAAAVWALGAGGMLLYALISWLRLRRRVAASLSVEEGVLVCDDIDGPFILGVLRPRIYLPAALASIRRGYVLAHERAHLERRDHWWKPLGFLLLSVYWFNPALWLCFVLFCRDLELACDERAVRDLEREDHVGYAQALLDCSRGRLGTGPCPLAFGETGVKGRVKEILRSRRPAPWLAAAALCACVVTAVCFLTSPQSEAWGDMEDKTVSGWLYRDGEVLAYVMENCEIDGMEIVGGEYMGAGVQKGGMGFKIFTVQTEDGEQHRLKAVGPWKVRPHWFDGGVGYGPEMKVTDVVCGGISWKTRS